MCETDSNNLFPNDNVSPYKKHHDHEQTILCLVLFFMPSWSRKKFACAQPLSRILLIIETVFFLN